MCPLVSIITPCYNGDRKIKVFLDSLLAQTYSNIEFIIVNDGSTDKTEEIIFSYKEKFELKGMKFIYLRQNNAGQAAALNNGLKHFTGQYIMWPDSDDILEPTCIDEFVRFLEENEECGLVHCNAKFVKDLDCNTVDSVWDRNFGEKSFKNFVDVLLWKNVMASGVWMVRSSAFLGVRPEREIEIMRQGQNWQMLLPLVYNYNIGKVDKFLFRCVQWKDSHSRIKRNFIQSKQRTLELAMGRVEIMSNMNMDDEHREYCTGLVYDDTNEGLFKLSCNNNIYGEAYAYWKLLPPLKKLKSVIKLILVRLGLYRIEDRVFVWRKK